MACNLDWVSFSVLLKSAEPELECPEGFRLELLGGNNIFRNRCIVYKDGAKALTLLWSPYSSTIDKHIMTVQIANYWLYSSHISAWFSVVQSIVDCTFNSMSRIDICVDFEVSARQQGIIRKLQSGAMYVAAKSEGSDWWHKSTYEGKESKYVHCLSWGAPTSQFKWKVYNKAREQNTDEHLKAKRKDGTIYVIPPDKPYIVEMWRQGGMDVSKIWRIELSISDTGLLRLEHARGQKIDMAAIDDAGLWYEIMCSEIERRFVIRKNQGHARRSDDERVYLLYLQGWKTALVHKSRNENPKPKPEVVSALKAIMRATENPVVMSDQNLFGTYYGMAVDLVTHHDLIGWCQRSLGESIDAWFERRWQSVGNGIHQATESISKMID